MGAQVNQDPGVVHLWEQYCASLPESERAECLLEKDEVWAFGDNPDMANRLGQLVLEGKKTATAGLLWDEEIPAGELPPVGAKAIIADGVNRPLCVIEYTDVTVMPLRDVEYAFAESEGEGFRSIDEWRQAHWRFFTRRCAVLQREPSELMPVLDQRFKVLFPVLGATSPP
jgi:uncharacterized protein YhfF